MQRNNAETQQKRNKGIEYMCKTRIYTQLSHTLQSRRHESFFRAVTFGFILLSFFALLRREMHQCVFDGHYGCTLWLAISNDSQKYVKPYTFWRALFTICSMSPCITMNLLNIHNAEYLHFLFCIIPAQA